MHKFFTHNDPFVVSQLKQALDGAKVPCFLKNEFASGAIGEIPPQDSQPEVWLVDIEWESEATKILEEIDFSGSKASPDWICKSCAEENEGTFETCWKCSTESPYC